MFGGYLYLYVFSVVHVCYRPASTKHFYNLNRPFLTHTSIFFWGLSPQRVCSPVTPGPGGLLGQGNVTVTPPGSEWV